MKSEFDDMGCGGALLIILGVLAFLGAIFCAEGWLLMTLWNWLAVSLFSAPALSFKMALGLMMLINLLTGGLRVTTSNSK